MAWTKGTLTQTRTSSPAITASVVGRKWKVEGEPDVEPT